MSTYHRAFQLEAMYSSLVIVTFMFMIGSISAKHSSEKSRLKRLKCNSEWNLTLTPYDRFLIEKTSNKFRTSLMSGTAMYSKLMKQAPQAGDIYRIRYKCGYEEILQNHLKTCTASTCTALKDAEEGYLHQHLEHLPESGEHGTHSVPILKILNKWWDEIEGFFEDGDETLNFTDARERNAPHFSQMAYAPVTSMACTFGKIRADEENKEDESVFICIYSAIIGLGDEVYKKGHGCSPKSCAALHSKTKCDIKENLCVEREDI